MKYQIINLTISAAEAKTGCRKTVRDPSGGSFPATIPANAKHGRIYAITSEATEIVYRVRVRIRGRALLSVICVLLAVGIVSGIVTSGLLDNIFGGGSTYRSVYELPDDGTVYVSVDPNGGNWKHGSTTYSNAVLFKFSERLKLSEPWRNGYTFIGWDKQRGAGNVKWKYTALWTEDATYSYMTTSDYVPVENEVKYVSIDPSGGEITVNGTVYSEAFTVPYESTIIIDGVNKNGYVFGGWDTFAGYNDIEYFYYAKWLPDFDNDGIADKYQKTVTYSIKYGQWANGQTGDITETVTLMKDGVPDENGEAVLTRVPTGMVPMTGYGDGAWDVVPETVTADSDGTYTYKYVYTDTEDDPENRETIYELPENSENVVLYSGVGLDYYYNQLSDSERKYYAAFYNTLQANETEFTITVYPEEVEILSKSFYRISEAVRYDHPELFWFDGSAKWKWLNYEDSSAVTVTVGVEDYWEGGEQGEQLRNDVYAAADAVVEEMNLLGGDQYTTVKAVHDKIVGMTSYDFVRLAQRNSGDTVADTEIIASAYGALLRGRSVCGGYAATMKLILDRMGIPCIVVLSDTHAWNIVWIDGEPTHIDVCWDDGSKYLEDGTFVEDNVIRNDYFGLTTDEIVTISSHRPVALYFHIPECTSTEYNYYIRERLYLENYSFDGFAEITERLYGEGDRKFKVKVGSSEELAAAKQDLLTNENMWNLPHFREGGSVMYLFNENTLTVQLEIVYK